MAGASFFTIRKSRTYHQISPPKAIGTRWRIPPTIVFGRSDKITSISQSAICARGKECVSNFKAKVRKIFRLPYLREAFFIYVPVAHSFYLLFQSVNVFRVSVQEPITRSNFTVPAYNHGIVLYEIAIPFRFQFKIWQIRADFSRYLSGYAILHIRFWIDVKRKRKFFFRCWDYV